MTPGAHGRGCAAPPSPRAAPARGPGTEAPRPPASDSEGQAFCEAGPTQNARRRGAGPRWALAGGSGRGTTGASGPRMRRLLVFTAGMLAATACGGGPKPSAPIGTASSEDLPEEVGPETAPEPEPPPPPPPPQMWQASASLQPLRGSKVKPFTVVFTQTEGEATVGNTEGIGGLKAGTYHLVVHEGSACGKNGAEAGPIWEDAGAGINLTVGKGVQAALQDEATDLWLAGERSIVDRTLVLHADKRGAPAKALACGIVTIDAPAPAEE